MSPPGNRLRALGGIETRMAAMHEGLLGTTQGSQVCVLKGALTLGALCSAARTLHEKYQALRCTVQFEQGTFAFFETVREVDVRQVSVSDATGFRGAVHEHYLDELNRPLDAASSLWRLLLVSGPGHDDAALVMTCHHAIMDGAGMFVLADQLLAHVDRAMAGVRQEPTASMMLAPEVDSFLAPERARVPESTPAPAQTQAMPHRRQVPLEQRRTFVEYCELSEDAHRSLRRRAALERLSINVLIAAAMARAFAELGFDLEQVPLKTAISLRQFAPEPYAAPSRLGCFISVANTPISLDPARSLSQLAECYLKTLNDAFAGCAANPGEAPARLAKKLEQLRDSQSFAEGIGLTNVGPVSITREFRHFRVVGYAGAANRRAGNVALVVSPSSFGDELGLPITFTEPAMDRMSVRHFANRLVRELSMYAEARSRSSNWIQEKQP